MRGLVRASTHPAALLVMFLAGCAAPVAPRSGVTPAVGLVPDTGGLQPNGTPLRIDFGRDMTGVITAVTRLKQAAPEPLYEVPGCGVVLVWEDGLRLTFVAGDFRGWALGERRAGTVCG